MTLSYSQAARDYRYLTAYTTAIEASLQDSAIKPNSLRSTENTALPVDPSHTSTPIRCIFASEECTITDEEAVRLAQLSPTFRRRFITSSEEVDGGFAIQKVNLIVDKFITGSAFMALTEIALHGIVLDAIHSAKTYSDLFDEPWHAWLSAILYVDEILGPFPNVHEWIETQRMGCPVAPAPMAHEFNMVAPHIVIDPHIRTAQLDCEGRYEFQTYGIRNKWQSRTMTQYEVANMMREEWSYMGSRVNNGEHQYVFRKPRSQPAPKAH